MATSGGSQSSNRRVGLRSQARWAMVVAVGAVVLAGGLLPRGDELFLIHVRNRDVVRAEQMLAQSDGLDAATAGTVVAHGEFYDLEGRIGAAVEEAEAYVEAHPDDLAGWTHLASLYRDGQRLHDWTRALAEVYRLEPTEGRARELVTRYRRHGDVESEAGVLRDLIAGGEATVGERVRSAELEAATGHYEASRDVLEDLRRRDPRSFDAPVMELYASVLAETGEPEEFARHFQTLPLVREEPQRLVALAVRLRDWGEVDAALSLLEPLPGVTPSPEQLEALAYTAVGTAAGARVTARLAAIDAETPLPAEALYQLVNLALSRAEYDLVEQLFVRHVKTLDPVLVGEAIGHAADRGLRDRAQRFVARFGDEGLANSPVLAVELAVERDDWVSARRWIDRIDAAGTPAPDDAAAVARLEMTLGEDERAFERLTNLAARGDAPPWALTDLATVAGRLGRGNEALTVLTPAARGSSEARAAWAQLAAATGRTDLIEAWFGAGAPRPGDAPVLRDLYYVLSDRQDVRLAIEAARRLYSITRSDSVVFGAARQTVDPALQAEAALIYDAGLYAAQASGYDVAPELRATFGPRLQDVGLPEDHRAMLIDGLWQAGERASLYEEVLLLARRDLDRWLSPLVDSARAAGRTAEAAGLVAAALGPSAALEGPALVAREPHLYALLDLGAPDEVVMPYLARFALTLGGTWIHAYDERLFARRLTPERIDLWTAVGHSNRASADDRRTAAARLHELGATARAADVIQPLASFAGPTDPDTELLLFFWGPQPSSAGRAWLASRLRAAPPTERLGWITHLVNAGGAAEAVAAMPVLPDSASPALVQAWVSAHVATADHRRAQAALETAIRRPGVTDAELPIYGRAAIAEGAYDLAERAFRKVLDRHPRDLEATRWLGTLAFQQGRLAEARTRLTAYVTAGGDEAEPLFQLGELALGDGNQPGAREYFRRAHDRLVRAEPDEATRALLANVLVRLDQPAQAGAVFEGLLRQSPGLDHVRADYASALIQWGDHRQAGIVLGLGDGPNEVPGTVVRGAGPVSGSVYDIGGARRLQLLRVQWLTHGGRYRDAERALDALVADFPSDADVLLARGTFEAERGWFAAADASFEAARAQAPDREDIARLVDERRRLQSPRATLETSSRGVRNGWDERRVRATFESLLTPTMPVSFAIEQLHVATAGGFAAVNGLRRIDAVRSRFEARLGLPVGSGMALTGMLFGTGEGLGLGGTLTRYDLYGVSSLTVERGQPFWEFIEGVAADGRRDRLAAERQWRLGALTSAWVQASWNRYRLTGNRPLSSATLGAGITRVVWSGTPTLAVQYGLDLERSLPAAADTSDLRIVPLASREVHMLGAVGRFSTTLGDVETAAGYTIDRLGGRGSFLSSRLSPRPGARLGMELWVDWRLYSLATSQRALQAGVALKVGF